VREAFIVEGLGIAGRRADVFMGCAEAFVRYRTSLEDLKRDRADEGTPVNRLRRCRRDDGDQ
jgi:hypothetical protein